MNTSPFALKSTANALVKSIEIEVRGVTAKVVYNPGANVYNVVIQDKATLRRTIVFNLESAKTFAFTEAHS